MSKAGLIFRVIMAENDMKQPIEWKINSTLGGVSNVRRLAIASKIANELVV